MTNDSPTTAPNESQAPPQRPNRLAAVLPALLFGGFLTLSFAFGHVMNRISSLEQQRAADIDGHNKNVLVVAQAVASANQEIATLKDRDHVRPIETLQGQQLLWSMFATKVLMDLDHGGTRPEDMKFAFSICDLTESREEIIEAERRQHQDPDHLRKIDEVRKANQVVTEFCRLRFVRIPVAGSASGAASIPVPETAPPPEPAE